MSLHQSHDSSINLQIRILLVLCLLLMAGLLLSRIVQGATLGVRMEAVADKLAEQQKSIDQLEVRTTTGGGVRPPDGVGINPSPEQARIADLEARLAQLSAFGAMDTSTSIDRPVPGLPPALPSRVPATLHGGEAVAESSGGPDPVAGEDPRMAALVKIWREQQPVAMVEQVNPDGTFAVLRPVEGMTLVAQDQILVGRDGVGPVAMLVISRVEQSGLAIADKLPDQQSLIGEIQKGDMACIY